MKYKLFERHPYSSRGVFFYWDSAWAVIGVNVNKLLKSAVVALEIFTMENYAFRLLGTQPRGSCQNRSSNCTKNRPFLAL